MEKLWSLNETQHKLVKILLDMCSYNLYLVGGAVRNHYLGIPNDDIDLAIECNEEQLEQLAKHLSNTTFYKNFGVLMFNYGDEKIEVTMTRTEMYRGKDRHPVVQPANIIEDLRRRDFKCNAIAVNLRTGEVLDPFDGVNNIVMRILDIIDDREDAVFVDDPLRILRAFRFAQKYTLKFSSRLTKRIRKDSTNLSWLSKERIHDELIKMAGLPGFDQSCKRMMELGVLPILFPKLSQLQTTYFQDGAAAKHKDMWIHTLQVVERIDRITTDPLLKLAALLHDCGKPMTAKLEGNTWVFHRHEQVGAKHVEDILPKIGFGKNETERVAAIVGMHQLPVQMTEAKDRGLRRFINKAGDHLEDLLTLASCDFSTANPNKQFQCVERINELRGKIKELTNQEDFVNFKLRMRGDQIATMLGIKPGPGLGRAITFLESLVLDDVIDNTPEKLEQVIKHLKEYIYAGESTKPLRVGTNQSSAVGSV